MPGLRRASCSPDGGPTISGAGGVRAITLAERAGLSKQVINQLPRSLEGLGYIVRSTRLARTVRLTKRSVVRENFAGCRIDRDGVLRR
jgi:hypothetical protein